MTSKRRTEITIETHEIKIIRVNGGRQTAFCPRCGCETAVFSPEQFAIFFRLSLAEVCRRVEAEQIHLTNNGRGAALICGNLLEETINHK